MTQCGPPPRIPRPDREPGGRDACKPLNGSPYWVPTTMSVRPSGPGARGSPGHARYVLAGRGPRPDRARPASGRARRRGSGRPRHPVHHRRTVLRGRGGRLLGPGRGPPRARRPPDRRVLPPLPLRGGSFEFVANEAPPWPAERGTDIAPIVETVEHIVRAWPAVEAVLPSFDVRPELGHDLPEESVTLSRSEFKLHLIDGSGPSARSPVSGPQRRGGRSGAEGPRSSTARCGSATSERSATGERDRDVRDRPALGAASTPSVKPSGSEGATRWSRAFPTTAALDREALERARAALAARAGLDDPDPPGVGPRATSTEPRARRRTRMRPRTEITSDRGALLRLFSGLRDQG